MVEIPLSNSSDVALIDDEDFDLISKFSWRLYKSRAHSIRYAVTGRNARMHRIIMNAQTDQMVDHVNRDGLDNRRENLRLCDAHQNSGNRLKNKNHAGFKGVRWDRGKWETRIKVNGRDIYLGRFKTETEAAAVYDRAAKSLWEESARTNL